MVTPCKCSKEGYGVGLSYLQVMAPPNKRIDSTDSWPHDVGLGLGCWFKLLTGNGTSK